MDKAKVILISGSRVVKDKALVESYIRNIITTTDDFRRNEGKLLIIHGGASGVDYEVRRTAEGYQNVTVQQFLPNYAIYGKSAPIIRNKEMVNLADEVYVIWDGLSPGAESVIEYAKKMGKLAQVYKIE